MGLVVKDADPIEESSRDSGRGPERADPELIDPEPRTSNHEDCLHQYAAGSSTFLMEI